MDGVLTDGSLFIQEDGKMLRSMNVKDGFALQWAIKQGYEVLIISGGISIGSQIRLQNLGIKGVFIDVGNKKELLEKLSKEKNWDHETLLYMGDDLPDIGVLQLCGLKTCPKDAVAEVKKIADYISPYPGGKGCVRDVIEKVMKLHGKWQ